MARELSKLRLGLHADEELNGLLGAVNIEMALAAANRTQMGRRKPRHVLIPSHRTEPNAIQVRL